MFYALILALLQYCSQKFAIGMIDSDLLYCKSLSKHSVKKHASNRCDRSVIPVRYSEMS
jgi:hypothetical protein